MRVDLHLAYEASGNLIADKRFGYALALLEQGEAGVAADLLAQTLELVPHWAPAHYARGEALSAAGDRDGAAAAYGSALRLDPRDRLGCGPRLAALGHAPVPDGLPPAYVRALFDQYAGRFDTELVEQLQYSAPWHLRGLLETCLGGQQVPRALDLGCGTGLMGEACRNMTSWLAGIDLSGEMIAASASKQIYDILETGDVVHFLDTGEDRFDLITAADVLVYFGDLAPLVGQVARRLCSGGLFAFSCEQGEGDGYVLGPALRFSHSRAYIEAILNRHGLDIVALENAACRKEGDGDVAAWFVIARRTDTAERCDSAADAQTEKRISP